MAVPDRARRALYDRLHSVLGEDEAQTMIELLPPGEPHDLATKADLAVLGDKLGVRMDRFEQRMDRFEERMDRFEERMDRFEEKMEGFEKQMDRFDDRLHDFHGALRQQTNNFILASTGSVITVGGLAFAAAALI